MSDLLRDSQSFQGLADNKQAIEIYEQIDNFKRLCESVGKDLSVLGGEEMPDNWRANRVCGRLDFAYLGEQSTAPVLRGELKLALPAVCQRCMKAFEWPLQTTLSLALVRASAADIEDVETEIPRAPADYELWELPDDTVRPIDIIDEALVMALPMAPKHVEMSRCIEFEQAARAPHTMTPFASLRTAMDRDKQN
ncbi:MAG TPA: YceD family protein [Woeseiaceae bacterium]|nr:YceD family protein [Woeseiaceae bacterium]